MVLKDQYLSQVKLLLDVLPYAATPEFVLKGGTVINLFYRDMPRLSVDIDLAMATIMDRKTSISAMSDHLEKLSAQTSKMRLQPNLLHPDDPKVKLLVSNESSQIKVEPNPVIRGTVFESEKRKLSPAVCERFELDLEIHCTSFADAYGGKLCAALDRQHPRDLFDVKLLLENEGLTEKVRQAFIVYLLSHPRPIAELLAPKAKSITHEFSSQFDGMTDQKVTEKDLAAIQAELPAHIISALSDTEKEFILKLKEGEPDWQLFPIAHVKDLPAIQWKLQNIGKMAKKKHKVALEKLQSLLRD